MAGIPESTLRMMRREQAKLLTARASVYRATTEPGSNKPNFVLVHRDMPCSVNGPKASGVGEAGERNLPTHENVIKFEVGSDVVAGDLIKVGDTVFEAVGNDAHRTILTVLSAYAVSDKMKRAQFLIGK